MTRFAIRRHFVFQGRATGVSLCPALKTRLFKFIHSETAKIVDSLKNMALLCLFVGLAKQDDILQCPSCLVQGEQADAEASCVKVTKIKPCREPQPVCAQITAPGVFQRLCASQAEFDNFKASCEVDNSCQVVKLSSPPAPRQVSSIHFFS